MTEEKMSFLTKQGRDSLRLQAAVACENPPQIAEIDPWDIIRVLNELDSLRAAEWRYRAQGLSGDYREERRD